ncbi:MAG: HlyD family efflux transporter periplasmic adaptor subunit [Candidatus Hydrogenedentes bacterium]|nr:HlyD family efflux transporter periplasmic adaptor subunit [Candidatus Hydrogenedentota bacterium]
MLTRTGMLLLVVAAVTGCTDGTTSKLRVTGTIEGTSIGVGSRIGGRVAEVMVSEGNTVAAGDVLVKLECGEQEAAIVASKARLAQAEATIERLETGARPEELAQAQAVAAATEAAYMMALNGARSEEIEAARALANAAMAQLETARSDFERIGKLLEGKAVSQQAFDQALRTYEARESQYRAAREQLDLLARGTRNEQIEMAKAERDRSAAAFDLLKNGARKEDLDFARAARDAAQAETQRAELQLREMTVIAPRAAVVESLDIHAGDLAGPGSMMQLADPEDLELVVYVSSALLGNLSIGQEVTFTTDSHGPELFTGKVSFIALQGEFTPRNLQTEEERAQQMFGIKIAFDSHDGRLRPGMAATAHLNASVAK